MLSLGEGGRMEEAWSPAARQGRPPVERRITQVLRVSFAKTPLDRIASYNRDPSIYTKPLSLDRD